MKPEQLRGEAKSRFDVWRSLGMSEASAMSQLYDDGLLERDGGESLKAAFRGLGLSETAAEVAVAGRHPAGDMRAAGRGESDAATVFADLQEAYRRLGYSRDQARYVAAAAVREAWDASKSAQDQDAAALATLRTRLGQVRLALVGEARGAALVAPPTRSTTPAAFINGVASEARGAAAKRSGGSPISLNENRRRG